MLFLHKRHIMHFLWKLKYFYLYLMNGGQILLGIHKNAFINIKMFLRKVFRNRHTLLKNTVSLPVTGLLLG